VRFTILPSTREDSRRRMAGGEERLGTDSTYMGKLLHNYAINADKYDYYMGT
jgi:hypothetical protein